MGSSSAVPRAIEGLRRRPVATASAVVVLLAAIGYGGALGHGFVFDDGGSIVDNELVHRLSSYLGSQAGYRANPNRYVGNLSFALSYAIGGAEPAGFRAVNVAIHAGAALLVFALVVLLFRTPVLARSRLAPQAPVLALCAAALFVAHPLQTGAVTYIVQRLTSLATLFYLATVVLYLLSRTRPGSRGWAYAGALATALLAMKTKEIAFTLPVALVGVELLFFEGPRARRLAAMAPLCATALLIPLAFARADAPITAVVEDVAQAADYRPDREGYWRTQLGVTATYLRLLVLPVGQNLDHDYPIAASVLEPRPLIGLALILGLLALAAWAYRRLEPAGRLVTFGVLWFFAALSVEAGVPLNDVIVEHRVYLPSVGFMVAVVTGTALALGGRRGDAFARPLLGIAGAVTLVLLAATVIRNRAWKDALTIWTDTVAKSPGKARPHYNRGHALVQLGRQAEAIPELQRSIALNPNRADAHNNLGAALDAVGRPAEALPHLHEATRLDPKNAEAHANLGRVHLHHTGRFDVAVQHLERAIALAPRNASARANLAAALNQLRRYEQTRALLESSRQTWEGSPEAHFNLGVAHVALADFAAAEREAAALERAGSPEAARLRAFIAQVRAGQ